MPSAAAAAAAAAPGTDRQFTATQCRRTKHREQVAALVAGAWSRRLSGSRWAPLLAEFVRATECPPDIVASALAEYVCSSPVPSPLLASFLTEAVASATVPPLCFYALLDREHLRRQKVHARQAARLLPAATAALPAVREAVRTGSPDVSTGNWLNVVGLVISVCRLGKVALGGVANEASEGRERDVRWTDLVGTAEEVQEAAEQAIKFLIELGGNESFTKFVTQHIADVDLWRELQSTLRALRVVIRTCFSSPSCNMAPLLRKLESSLGGLSPGEQCERAANSRCGVAVRYILHQLVFSRLTMSDEEAVRRLRRVQMIEGSGNIEFYFRIWVTALRELRLCCDSAVRLPDVRNPWYLDMRPDGSAADARLYRTFVLLKLPQLFKPLLRTDRIDSADDEALALVTQTVLDRLRIFPNLFKPREADVEITGALRPVLDIIPDWEDVVRACSAFGLLPVPAEEQGGVGDGVMHLVKKMGPFDSEDLPRALQNLRINASEDDIGALCEMAMSDDQRRQLIAYRCMAQTMVYWAKSMNIRGVAFLCRALAADPRLMPVMVLLEGAASILSSLELICNHWTVPPRCEPGEKRMHFEAYGTVFCFALRMIQRLPGAWLLQEEEGFLFRCFNMGDSAVRVFSKGAKGDWICAMFGEVDDLANFVIGGPADPREAFMMASLAVDRCLEACDVGAAAPGDLVRGILKLREPCLQFILPGAVGRLSERMAFSGAFAIPAVEALRVVVGLVPVLSPEVGRAVTHLALNAIGGVDNHLCPALVEIRAVTEKIQKQDPLSRPLCHVGEDSVQLVRRAFRDAVGRELATSGKPMTDIGPRWGEELMDLEVYPHALRTCVPKLVIATLIQEVLAAVDDPQTADQTVELAGSILATDWTSSVGPAGANLTLTFLRDVLTDLLRDPGLSYSQAAAVGRVTVHALAVGNTGSRPLYDALDVALLAASGGPGGKLTARACGFAEGLKSCPRLWAEISLRARKSA